MLFQSGEQIVRLERKSWFTSKEFNMQEKPPNSLVEENEQLRLEIIELQKKLKELQEEQIEYASHKIYRSAQRKFIAWFSIIMFALSLFGIISINNIIQSMKTKIELSLISVIAQSYFPTVYYFKGGFSQLRKMWSDILTATKTPKEISIQVLIFVINRLIYISNLLNQFVLYK